MVKGRDTLFRCGCTQPMIPSEERQTLSHQVVQTTNVFKVEIGKPVSFFKIFFGVRRKQFPMTMVRVKEDGASECPAVMAGIVVQTLPHAKAGRLPSGVLSQETCE